MAMMMGRPGLALLVCALVLAACGGSDDGATPTATAPASTPAGAATPATTATTPAVVDHGYGAEAVFPNINFDQMLGMVNIPGQDGHVVVLTKTGVVYRASIADPTEEPSVFLDIRDRIKQPLANEEGLLGLAFSPDYATDNAFYIDYSAGNPRRNVISRFVSKGDAADPASETVLLEIEQPFSNHNGGALVFGPDGMLYISSGDGGSGGDPRGNGQNTDVLLGKILRIDVSGGGGSYAIPPDNPFANGGGRGEVWAYGLRNPWRITFDSANSELWAADVGQGEIEEIDRIEKGGNYGWNIMEGPQCFRASTCDQSGLIPPRASYGHETGSCSVTGGYVYHGDALPELDGWYIYGDYCSGLLWGFDASSDTSEPVLLSETGLTITSFAVDPAGELYLVTFDKAIYRLARAE
jgi:glucose/arabinose dehydrogenase